MLLHWKGGTQSKLLPEADAESLRAAHELISGHPIRGRTPVYFPIIQVFKALGPDGRGSIHRVTYIECAPLWLILGYSP